MSGFVGDLSPKQSAALEKLKEKIADVADQFDEEDDHYYLRWLRARNFDVEKTDVMMREHLVAKETWGLKDILQWDSTPVLNKYFTGRVYGNDREGRPILWERIGKLDLRGVVKAATKEDIVRHRLRDGVHMVELMEEQTKKLGKLVDTCVIIYDLEGLSIQKHFVTKGIQAVVEIVKVFESNFPEILESVYIVNVPGIFDLAYNIVKPFLNEVTRKKVHPIPGPPEVFQERLRELIEPSVLPACYGGSFVTDDGDLNCDSVLCGGGLIPRSMYLSAKGVPVNEENRSVAIARGSTEHVEVKVPEAGSTLSWGFGSETYDIMFSVLYKPDGQAGVKLPVRQMEELVPNQHVDSQVNFIEGSIHCEKAGVYVLRFDNKYSWTRAKLVHYNVQIEMPKGSSGTPEPAAAAAAAETAAPAEEPVEV